MAERAAAQMAGDRSCSANSRGITFHRESNSGELWHGATYERHHGMDGGDPGAAFAKRCELVAGQGSAGMEDGLPFPLLHARQPSGRRCDGIVRNSNPDDISVQRLFPQLDHASFCRACQRSRFLPSAASRPGSDELHRVSRRRQRKRQRGAEVSGTNDAHRERTICGRQVAHAGQNIRLAHRTCGVCRDLRHASVL